MISKILITIAVVLVLAGLLGIRTKTIGKKMLFVSISCVGMTVMSFAELNAYGLIGGAFQILFRFLSLLFLIVLFRNVCKRNQIVNVEDINGIGREMPYIFMAAVIYSMIIIGIPATGTFTGVLYSEIGLFAGGFGVFTYVGLIGNIVGIVVPAVLLLPILKRAYFPGTEAEKRETIVKPEKGMVICNLIMAFLLTVLCIYQKPVMTLAGALMEKIFG